MRCMLSLKNKLTPNPRIKWDVPRRWLPVSIWSVSIVHFKLVQRHFARPLCAGSLGSYTLIASE